MCFIQTEDRPVHVLTIIDEMNHESRTSSTESGYLDDFMMPEVPEFTRSLPKYDVSRSGRIGNLLIINNMHFDKCLGIQDRSSSKWSDVKLYQAFEKLGFEAQIMVDVDCQTMESAVQRGKLSVLSRFYLETVPGHHISLCSVYHVIPILSAAVEAGTSGVGCFALAVLSHGNEGVVYGTDGKLQVQTLTESVLKVSELVGKPKLFFIEVGYIIFI